MQWTAPDLLPNLSMTYVVAGIAAAITWIAHLSQRPNLDAFPTVGSSGWLGSWWAGIKYMTNATDVIREGYKKYNGAPFKVATFCRWVVIVSRRALVEELRSARSDELSFLMTLNEDFNSDVTLGSEVLYNPYHTGVIRSQLTHNVGVLYPDLRDEIITAFDETLDLKDNGDVFLNTKNNESLIVVEWKSVPASTAIQQIMCRSINRSLVGLPLCRNPDFVALNVQHTINVMTGGLALKFFPNFLKPLAIRFITNISKNTRRVLRLLRPVIEERRRYMNEYGDDWTDKPNDFLSWLMDEASPDATVESLTNYVLATNFTAIFPSCNIFTCALYNLAANPEYIQPLREEVEAIVEKEGWSKASLSKMCRIDSILRESARMEGLNLLGLTRKAIKNFMFSDGTLIPKGTRISAGLVALHFDGALYENPEVFDPFRFANMHEKDGDGARHQFVTTSPEYLLFGHGQHACPGRFFVAAVLKSMLAHIVMTYDLKLEENTTRPRSWHIGSTIIPNPTAKVMFRERGRQDEGH